MQSQFEGGVGNEQDFEHASGFQYQDDTLEEDEDMEFRIKKQAILMRQESG